MKLTKRDVDDVYRLDFGSGTAPIFLSEEEMEELRAHLQAERDEALGRWRDSQEPDMVCYLAKEDSVYVFNERTGNRAFYWLRDSLPARLWLEGAERDSYDTAGRYFAAHPEPKPWEKAQPDEIWVLTDGDRSEVFRCGEHGLYSLKTGDPISRVLPILTVTAGRRIWPEEDK